jgi:hypothetical protein
LDLNGNGPVRVADLAERSVCLDRFDHLKYLVQSRFGSFLYFAAIYTGLGENRMALDWPDRAYTERNDRLVSLGSEPMADPLHSDPRIARLLANIGAHLTVRQDSPEAGGIPAQ